MSVNWRKGEPPDQYRRERLLIIGLSQAAHAGTALEICIANYNTQVPGIVPTWLGGQDRARVRPTVQVKFWVPLDELDFPVAMADLVRGDLTTPETDQHRAPLLTS